MRQNIDRATSLTIHPGRIRDESDFGLTPVRPLKWSEVFLFQYVNADQHARLVSCKCACSEQDEPAQAECFDESQSGTQCVITALQNQSEIFACPPPRPRSLPLSMTRSIVFSAPSPYCSKAPKTKFFPEPPSLSP